MIPKIVSRCWHINPLTAQRSNQLLSVPLWRSPVKFWFWKKGTKKNGFQANKGSTSQPASQASYSIFRRNKLHKAMNSFSFLKKKMSAMKSRIFKNSKNRQSQTISFIDDIQAQQKYQKQKQAQEKKQANKLTEKAIDNIFNALNPIKFVKRNYKDSKYFNIFLGIATLLVSIKELIDQYLSDHLAKKFIDYFWRYIKGWWFLKQEFNDLKQIFRKLKEKPQLYKDILQQTRKKLKFQITKKDFQYSTKIMFLECCEQDLLPQIALNQIRQLDNFQTLMNQRKINNIRLQNRSKYNSTQDYLQKINYFLQDISQRIKIIQLRQRYLPCFYPKDDKSEKILVLIDNLQQLSNPLLNQLNQKGQFLRIFNQIRQLKSEHTNINFFVKNTYFLDELISQANLKEQQFNKATVYIKKEEFDNKKSQFFKVDKIKALLQNPVLTATDKQATAKIIELLFTQFSDTFNYCRTVNVIQKIIKQKIKDLEKIEQQKKDEEIKSKQKYKEIKSKQKYKEIKSKQKDKGIESQQKDKGIESKQKDKGIQQNLYNKINDEITELLKSNLINRTEYLRSKVFTGQKKACFERIKLLYKIHKRKSLKHLWTFPKLIIQNLTEQQREAYKYLSQHQVIFDFDFYSKDYEKIFIMLLQRHPYYIQNLYSKNPKNEDQLFGEPSQELFKKISDEPIQGFEIYKVTIKLVKANQQKINQTQGKTDNPSNNEEDKK